MWFLLKLIGIKKFLLANWKWVLPTAALIASYFIVSHVYYNKGVLAERSSWETKIAKESAKNAKETKHIADTIVNYGARVKAKDQVRVQKETVYKDRILTVIKENKVYTDCKVDQSVLDNMNAIRAQVKP